MALARVAWMVGGWVGGRLIAGAGFYQTIFNSWPLFLLAGGGGVALFVFASQAPRPVLFRLSLFAPCGCM